jgi:hypothetical protein
VVAALAVLAGACALPTDDQPDELAADGVPAGLLEPAPTSTTSTTLPVQTLPVNLFFFDAEDTLRPESRQIPAPITPADVLRDLFEGTTEQGKSTAIPPDVELVDATVDEATGILTVSLNDALFAIQSTELVRAIAQIVYTATQLSTVRSVRFEIDGEIQAVPVGDGGNQTRPVTKDDFPNFDPLRTPATSTTSTTTTTTVPTAPPPAPAPAPGS